MYHTPMETRGRVSYLFEPPEDVSSRQASATRRDTKAIGDRSEAMVLAALVRNGYHVSIPFGENNRYDLLADDGARIVRVQVKSGRVRKGAISYSCCSTHAHRRAGPLASRSYRGEVDYIAVYCDELRKVYLVPEEELARTRAHLRLIAPTNGQRRKLRWAHRFELP